jgi:hypothetical protein
MDRAAIDGEPAGYASSGARRATCTIIRVPMFVGLAGAHRPTVANDEANAKHSSNSLFVCIQSTASIKEVPRQLNDKNDLFHIYNLLD